MDRVELLFHRRQTQALLREEGKDLAISRPAMVNSAGGGKRPGPPTILPVQRLALVPAKQTLSLRGNASDGTQMRDFEWLLVGRYDADLKKGDRFELDGNDFEVEVIIPDGRDYQTLAGVETR